MHHSKRPFRFNKDLTFLIAFLIASVFLVPWVSAQGLVPPTGAQAQAAPAANAGVPPAAAPTVDDIPGAGHLTDDLSAVAGPQKSPGLQLDVLINGYKIDLVAGFVLLPDGSMTSARSELRELGLKMPGEGPDDQQINLASVPGLLFKYDPAQQTIDLQISDAGRQPKSINVIPKKELLIAESDMGLVLNYSGYGAASIGLDGSATKFSGASVNLDARAFSKFGVVQQTGILGTTSFSDLNAIRLDSNWSYSNQDRAETYTIGDVISGGLNWTRPVRMGGGQVQRNFGIRPDLITTPMPSLAGSAAVPSTLDVYINNAKTFSQSIEPGPFSIDRLPVITSQGTARVVITDSTGRQTQSETELFSSASLLAPNLFDYSLDLGFARRSFGTDSFAYDGQLMAIASARYGVTDRFTVEAHAEARADMLEGGLGGVFVAGQLGTFNAAAAASMFQGEIGLYGFASWEFEYKNLIARASTARTFGNFVDLAAVTELPINGIYKNGVSKALDQLTVSYGIPTMDIGTGLSLIHQVRQDDTESLIVGANITKSFRSDMSVYANAYIDIENHADYGAFIGFSIPFGSNNNGAGLSANDNASSWSKNVNASGGASIVKDSLAVSAEVSKPLDTSFGSTGWRVSASDLAGDKRLSAEGAYRDSHALVSGRLANNGGKISGSASIDGSIVATKSGVFLGNPIADSFAIVDAGVEGIDVSYENRFAGKTGKNGKLLISQLHSYQNNKISINPENLPLNSSVTETEKHIATRSKSGVLVDFGVKKDGNGVIVILKDANDKFVAPGTVIKVEGKDEPFVMGYDGEVYLTNIPEHVNLTAEDASNTCAAAFDFKAEALAQTSIGPLQCL